MTKPPHPPRPVIHVDPALATPTPPTPEFLTAAAELGLAFEPTDVDRLARFLAILLHANQTTNLTAITDPAAAWMKDVLDALTLVPALASLEPAPGGTVEVIDIGSGGGLPAIPLAIVLPEVRFTLVEATGKKVLFLREAAAAIGLANVKVVQDRAERLGQDHKAHRERYDAATSRALGHLAVVAELCGPLVRPGGFVLAVKGSRAGEELEQAGKALGLIGLRHTETLATPTGRVVVLEKTIRTPRLYPRKDGEPSRLPLGLPRTKTPLASPPAEPSEP